MGLYENIKNAAKMRNVTINQIEKELGFPRSSIAKFNKSVPSVDKMLSIAIYLNVSIEYLVTGKDPGKIIESENTLDEEAIEISRLYKNLNPEARKIVKGILKSNQ